MMNRRAHEDRELRQLMTTYEIRQGATADGRGGDAVGFPFQSRRDAARELAVLESEGLTGLSIVEVVS